MAATLVVVATSLLSATPAYAEWHIACDLDDQADVLNGLADEVRFKYYEECPYLPEAPEGYMWAEDITLIPVSY